MTSRACVVAALALLLLAPSAHAEENEEEVVHDVWFAQYQREKKAGWAHERRVRATQDGRIVIITESEAELMRGPDGGLMEKPIVSSSRFVEDEEGRVVSYATLVDIGMGAQTREGTVKDGVIFAKEDGKPRTVPYPEGALGPAALDRVLAGAVKPNGTAEALAFSALDPQTGRTFRWEVPEETQLVDILGRYAWIFVVKKTESPMFPENVFVDGTGASWGGAMNLGVIRYFRTEEAVAKADRDPVSWLREGIVVPDRAIPAEAMRSKTRLRLSWADGQDRDIPESNMQKVVARGEKGSLDLGLLVAPSVSDLVIWMRPYTGGDQEPAYLAATSLAELSNDRLKQHAARAVGERMDALGSAQLIERYAKSLVHPSPANVGWSSACGVISSRTGDFTETAVLCVAMARALGLPARLVAGFTYWDPDTWADGSQERGAFAFHTWAEIYVGDNLWHPVDPMALNTERPAGTDRRILAQTGYDATHVAVLRSDLETATPFTDIALPVLELMEGLTIKVLEPR